MVMVGVFLNNLGEYHQALEVLTISCCTKQAAIDVPYLLIAADILDQQQTICQVSMSRQLQPGHEALSRSELGTSCKANSLTLKGQRFNRGKHTVWHRKH